MGSVLLSVYIYIYPRLYILVQYVTNTKDHTDALLAVQTTLEIDPSIVAASAVKDISMTYTCMIIMQ